MAQYEKNYAQALREDLILAVKNHLTPAAKRYGYSETGLEVTIRWKPVVLILGNYSSGKSTFINELLGEDVQRTGQAPTDDSFTVLMSGDKDEEATMIDGQSLLHDARYPFERLKRHGDRFVSHFRGKRLKSEVLKDLAIIDTPGMLDSVSEKDRGYNYQQVVADLAEIADLVLILFDPHKAGTIRETYQSLRETLPASTFENRMIFVLNRIDECTNLNDLLRVYGTLCWNLSQMTGRKDIPMIHLTHAKDIHGREPDFLSLLGNSRDSLKQSVFDAPKYRLANLASFVETHGDRLIHLLEGYLSFLKDRRMRAIKNIMTGALISLLVSCIVGLGLSEGLVSEPIGRNQAAIFAGIFFTVFLLVWSLIFTRISLNVHKRISLSKLDQLTSLSNQHREDTWIKIKPNVEKLIASSRKYPPSRQVSRDLKSLIKIRETVSKDARSALVELENLRITPYV
ncbi:dynamin family protein [Oligoflexaceae bacterium]|nr:dynamin family protein [Oligoflexaceae bacterium]